MIYLGEAIQMLQIPKKATKNHKWKFFFLIFHVKFEWIQLLL